MQTRSTQLKLFWEKYHLGEDEEVEEEAGVDEVEEPALDRREEYGNVTFVYVPIQDGRTVGVPVSVTRRRTARTPTPRRWRPTRKGRLSSMRRGTRGGDTTSPGGQRTTRSKAS